MNIKTCLKTIAKVWLEQYVYNIFLILKFLKYA